MIQDTDRKTSLQAKKRRTIEETTGLQAASRGNLLRPGRDIKKDL